MNARFKKGSRQPVKHPSKFFHNLHVIVPIQHNCSICERVCELFLMAENYNSRAATSQEAYRPQPLQVPFDATATYTMKFSVSL